MKKNLCLVVTVTLLLSGCARSFPTQPVKDIHAPTPIPPERISTADYGLPPPDNYQDLVKTEISRGLIDPTSPLLTFDKPPEKGYIMRSNFLRVPEGFGWLVCGTVNSKNRYGGYVGAQPFLALMQGDTVTQTLVGSRTGPEEELITMGIMDVCSGRKIFRDSPLF